MSASVAAQPRRLYVLDINDEEDPDFVSQLADKDDHLGGFFDGHQLTSWSEVQQDLAGATPSKPDLLLIDVNFQKDGESKDVDFGLKDGLRPYGPLLALPYLNSRATSGATFYTGNDPKSDAFNNPWVLLALGLIAASQRRRLVASETFYHRQGIALPERAHTVEKFRAAVTEGRPTKRTDALIGAMGFYLQSFGAAVGSGIIKVTNAASLKREMDRLIAQLRTEPAGAEVPFPPSLYIQFISESHGIERIFLSSFCADILDFRQAPLTIERAEKISDRLSGYFTPDPIFNDLMDLIETLHRDELPAWERIDRSILREVPTASVQDRREMMRLAVLMANIEAWAHLAHEGADLSDVQSEADVPFGLRRLIHRRLGVQDNTYRDWLGLPRHSNSGSSRKPAKSGDKTPRKYAFSQTLKIPRLDPFDGGSSPSAYLLPGTCLSEEDQVRAKQYLSNVFAPDDFLQLPWFQ